ncbi:MAG: excinuclease ABC subunit UvrA, partial [Candidatus Rokuibacteriota bacterium]
MDYGLVVPDESQTLRGGAIRPWRTESYRGWNDDLVQYAKKRGVPLDTPWREIKAEERQWVIDGDPGWVSWRKSWPGNWYGVGRFFKWLERKAYKMHVRVLLSRYRAYTPCAACGGARLKTDALAWRLGTREDADAVLAPDNRFLPDGMNFGADVLARLPGLAVHDLMLLPIDRARSFFERIHLPWTSARKASQAKEVMGADVPIASGVASPEKGRVDGRKRDPLGSDPGNAHGSGLERRAMIGSTVASPQAGPLLHAAPIPAPPSGAPLDEATDLLLSDIRARFSYLGEVGLGYLTLDRQSRTLSGGEVQRINLTTALGTSLTSALFVLDEPSIGLHPRDTDRLVALLQALRDQGNTILVVEHDRHVMEVADHIVDLGPGAGEQGGRVVFQ